MKSHAAGCFVDTRSQNVTNAQADSAPTTEEILHTEFLWIQRTRGAKTFHNVIACLKECCIKLHLGQKCDFRLGIPHTQPITERYQLVGKHGGDNLKATITLLADNVIQAEVAIKHAKTPGGVYRAVAQPDVQWKLQQLQDLGNHISKATIALCEAENAIRALAATKDFDQLSGEIILACAKSAKLEISAARSSILLPRKRSLLELCHFPPTRKFVPPLPQDQLLSFYISSCRLVCASYQMVPKQSSPQGLSISLAECQLPYLDEILHLLNQTTTLLQKLIGDLSMCNRK